jgi:hypothetical protein
VTPRLSGTATVSVTVAHLGRLFPVPWTLVTFDLWNTPEGAARFAQEPEARQAQQASGLPQPATFERFPDADYTVYQA